jgi:hypothetical protein
MYGEDKVYIRFGWGNQKKRDHVKTLGIDGRIILKWSLKK